MGRLIRVEEKVVGDTTLACNLGDRISSFMLQDQDTWTCYIMSHIMAHIMPHHQCFERARDIVEHIDLVSLVLVRRLTVWT